MMQNGKVCAFVKLLQKPKTFRDKCRITMYNVKCDCVCRIFIIIRILK